MSNPIHKVKRCVNDGHKLHWTEDTITGWLASGIEDKHGVEIYEGDIVLCNGKRCEVQFIRHHFVLYDGTGYRALLELFDLEVIGHVAEE